MPTTAEVHQPSSGLDVPDCRRRAFDRGALAGVSFSARIFRLHHTRPRVNATTMSSIRIGILLLSSLTFPATGAAAPVLWPGTTSPCNGTLQACIDGVAELVTIEIRTTTPIDENLQVNRSVSLSAGRGFDVQLAAGRGISGSVSGGANWNTRISGIGLRDARVLLNHFGSGAANIEIDGLRITSGAPGAAAGIGVEVSNASSSVVRIANNQLSVAAPGLFDFAISVEFSGASGAHTSDILWNRIQSVGASEGWGILGSAVQGANATFQVQGNEVRGLFQRDAIMISEGLFSSTPSTVTARVLSNVVVGGGGFSGGISSVVNKGNTSAQIINNTVVRGDGIALSRWGGSGTPTGTTSGSIFNNLIVANRFGLQNTSLAGGTATNDYNLLHANASAGSHTPGANDVTADPLLRSLDAPRVSSGSPAIDAGSSLALLGGGALPLVDGDGLRRIVNGDGAGSTVVDIGAYEYGHRVFPASSAAASGNGFAIGDAVSDASNSSRLFTTPRRFPTTSGINPRPTGVYYGSLGGLGGAWLVFNQDLSTMSTSMDYTILHPLPSTTLSMRTFSTALPGSPNAMAISGPTSQDIVLAEQNWNGGGTSGVYNNNPVAVGFEGGSWFLHNANGTALPTGAKFNVYYQPPSPNAFDVVKSASDFLTDFALLIDHPLLNGQPCARFVVTPVSDTPAAQLEGSIFDVTYSEGAGYTGNKWRIFSHSGSIVGKRYHVLVVPEQVVDCSLGPLFRDGFED